MSFPQRGYDDQDKMVPFYANADEELEEEDEEVETQDLAEIGEDVNKAKEVQMNMADCKGVSIGPTTNFVFHVNSTDDVAILAQLLGQTSSQPMLQCSSNSFPSLSSACGSGFGPTSDNTQCYNPQFSSMDNSSRTINDISGYAENLGINGVRPKPSNSFPNFPENGTYYNQGPAWSNLRKIDWRKWKCLPEKFAIMDGYVVGIEPGMFYMTRSGKRYYIVEMPNGTNYSIKLTNNTDLRCKVNVYIDNRLVASLMMRQNFEKTLKGPQTPDKVCENFVFIPSSKDSKGTENYPTSEENGVVIRVEFIPEIITLYLNKTISKAKKYKDTSQLDERRMLLMGFDIFAELISCTTEDLPELGELIRASGKLVHKIVDDTREENKSLSEGATASADSQQHEMENEDDEDMLLDHDRTVTFILRLVAKPENHL